MKIKFNFSLNIYKVLLIAFTLSLVVVSLFSSQRNKALELDTEILSNLEYVSTGIQRISKLELENSSDNELINKLDMTISSLVNNSMSSRYFNNNQELVSHIQNIAVDWFNFKSAIETFRVDGDRTILFSISEENYTNSSVGMKKVSNHIKQLSTFSGIIENIIIINIIIIGLLLIKLLSNTARELQRNKELSKSMYIDLSTGLYNRSKCQEILKRPTTPKIYKERAVVIFDLNDLKKTNDTFGHRAGDQLISIFASKLKEASKIFLYEAFVGRYGGDEFMVYFDFVDEKDISQYIREVNRLLKEFNQENSKPFKLSCAVGYAITHEDTKNLTMRELFDIADTEMYKNKISMKEKARMELEAQGLPQPAVEDDRLC